jgi:hypothetical protein
VKATRCDNECNKATMMSNDGEQQGKSAKQKQQQKQQC